MSREDVKKMLDQQLELLAEKSKKEIRHEVVIKYVHAIAELAVIRLSNFKVD